jgi:signal transduction histidine kinase
VLSGEASLVERLLEHIAEIGAGKCSITDDSLAAEPDPQAQEILAGLLMLHEDLEFFQQRQAALFEDLRTAIRARDEFLSIASHELRTPITTLSLQVDGLDRAVREQPSTAFLQAISRRLELTRRQVDRLAKLVATLIDVSRVNSGRMELARHRADLAEVLRSVVERLSDEALRAGSPLGLEESGAIWGEFDVSRVEQVATNLLSNAIRYGRSQPILVRVSADGERARFSVEDGGIGIASEDLDRIFEQYERAAPATNYAGLGLGLWISRQLVLAMGGTISVRSQPGVGSVFTVELPRAT